MERFQSIEKLNSLVAHDELAKARNSCTNLTSRYPKDTEIWLMRLCLHNSLGEIDALAECIPIFFESLKNKPLIPEIRTALFTLANIFKQRLRIHDAINVYEKWIDLSPDDAQLHWYLSQAYLTIGNFQRGWTEMKWRHKYNAMHAVDFSNGPKWWDGSVLDGKTILVRTEQGKGDIIFFSRYLHKLKTLGAQIILDLRIHPSLKSLLEDCVDTVVSHDTQTVDNGGNPNITWDMETNIVDLPGMLHTSLENIPQDIPYLKIPPTAGKVAIAAINSHAHKLRIGLVWAGNKLNTNDHLRSLKFNMFKELLANREVMFFSLQKDAREIINLEACNIIDLAPFLNDFADSAAAIQELDLVISVDTAVAHLAGALGKPVWTLIPFVPDWRWMLDREDSPWYPTMCLFRQPNPGDWTSVIKRVTTQLTELVQRSATDHNDPLNCHLGAAVRE